MKAGLKEELIEFLTAPLNEIGVVIADIALSVYKKNTTLRLFVYTENGTTLDECARISKFVGNLLETTEYFEEGYLLEVSSPGLDRPLVNLNDFKYRVGENVKLTFADNNKKKRTAEISAVEDDVVVFKDADEIFSVPMKEIGNAKIIF